MNDIDTKHEAMKEKGYSVETELAFRMRCQGQGKDPDESWKRLNFVDTDELFIDNDDLEHEVEYEARIRKRYLREDKSPLTSWGPWSPPIVFKRESE